MISHILAGRNSTDLEVDWTAITLGCITTFGVCYTAWSARQTRRNLKTTSGKNIGEHVQDMEESISATAIEVAKSLTEARKVREHEAAEAVIRKAEHIKEMDELEKSRIRVAKEIERLARLRPTEPKDGKTND